MNFTGERLHSDIQAFWAVEHFHRYAIAQDFVNGKDVLDIASGEGYGSHLLSQSANTVIGVDISEEAVAYAQSHYKAGNLSYKSGSADNIPLHENAVDVVVSFETIEHHDKHHEMMKEVKRVLRPGGILVISSPDKLNYSDVPKYSNPYHIKELYKQEFKNLVKEYFSNCVFVSQRTCYGSLVVPDDVRVAGFSEYQGDSTKITRSDEFLNPVYNIAVCSDDILSGLPASFFSAEAALKLAFDKQQEQIDKLKNSYAYRIGRKITYPAHYIKRIFK